MLFLLFTAFTTTGFASSFYEQPFPEVVKGAAQIVRGKVGKSETQWTVLPDGSKHLFTYYEVEVTEGFKGKPKAGTPIRIRELGGEKNGVSLQVSGSAHFGTGEDIVVMLGEGGDSGDSAYPVMGMMMGKFNLEKGADGKEYLKGPGLGSSTHPTLRKENAPTQTKISLEGLREIVRTQAAEVGAEKTSIPSAVKPKEEPLLSAKANKDVPGTTQVPNENLTPPLSEKKDGSFRPLLLLLGAMIGGLWFLKSKMKRR